MKKIDKKYGILLAVILASTNAWGTQDSNAKPSPKGWLTFIDVLYQKKTLAIATLGVSGWLAYKQANDKTDKHAYQTAGITLGFGGLQLWAALSGYTKRYTAIPLALPVSTLCILLANAYGCTNNTQTIDHQTEKVTIHEQTPEKSGLSSISQIFEGFERPDETATKFFGLLVPAVTTIGSLFGKDWSLKTLLWPSNSNISKFTNELPAVKSVMQDIKVEKKK